MYQLRSTDFFTNKNNSIALEVRTPQENFPEHSHDFQELIIVSKGSGVHVVNDVPTHVTKNHICFVDPSVRHSFENVDNLHLSNLLFRRDKLFLPSQLKKYIPEHYSAHSSWHINNTSMGRMNQLIKYIDQEICNENQDSELMVQALFQQLVVEINRGKSTEVGMMTMDDKTIQVLEWVKAHYHEDISINEISDKFHLSSRTLSRKMKQITNLSFNNYLHNVRINNAIQMLQYSTLSITDIAFKIGYSDSNYFSTKFKKFTKKSPSDYR